MSKPIHDATVHINSFVRRQVEGTPGCRRFDELPELPEASNCNVILYSHAALAEDNDYETDCDYEIVSINANQLEYPGSEPIPPHTLMHNHFGSSGGTATKMSPEKFEAQLGESFLYWSDKANIDGRKSYWKVSDEVLLQRVQEALMQGRWAEGYRPEVLEVHIRVESGEFFCPTVTLEEGDELSGSFKVRRKGEAPRKTIGWSGKH